MELIYFLLREFRYFFKSRKIKKYLTIIIIYILFLFLLSTFNTRVFAVSNGYGLPYTTYENYTYNNIPSFPSGIDNYEYICIVPFYNYTANISSNNRVVLLYSHNPFTYEDSGNGGRKVLYSNDLCDLGYYYYIDSENFSSWSTNSMALWRDKVSNAHFYFFDQRNPQVFYTNNDIYFKNGSGLFCGATVLEPEKIAPFITNQSGSIENWDAYTKSNNL